MSTLRLFLMTKNELELIDDWIQYHAHFFGMENIYILDGSDNEEVLGIYEHYKKQGLNVRHSQANLNELADELTQYMNENKGVGNFIIKLDTDEFIGVTKPILIQPFLKRVRRYQRNFIRKFNEHALSRKMNLRESLFDYSFRLKRVSNTGVLDRLRQLPITGQRYKASLTTWSVPLEHYSPRPCRDIVTFTRPQFTHLKTFFHSDSFVSVDLGSHVGVSTNMDGFIDTGLTIIHYHSVSVPDSMRRAHQVLVSHGYIDQADSLEEQFEKLSVHEGKRINSHHKISQYTRYLRSQREGKALNPADLNRFHPHYREARVRKMTLVRDTLGLIEAMNAETAEPKVGS